MSAVSLYFHRTYVNFRPILITYFDKENYFKQQVYAIMSLNLFMILFFFSFHSTLEHNKDLQPTPSLELNKPGKFVCILFYFSVNAFVIVCSLAANFCKIKKIFLAKLYRK